MPRSEASLDHDATKLYRLRYVGYTGELGGVLFERGEAQAGVTLRVVQRLQGIFGAGAVQLVGPWEESASEPSESSEDARASEDDSAPPDAPDLPLAPPSPTTTAPTSRRRTRKDDTP